MKVDILAFGAHPDDVELACSGTILKHIQQGKKVGIVDLTMGELGTRGSGELRLKEAAAAAKILGVSFRDNLGMSDGFFKNDETHQLEVIKKIRQYQPDIVLANALDDRHPDHGRGANLVKEACFYAGLRKVETTVNGQTQQAWRPRAVYHYIQDRYLNPDFVVDVTEFYDQKMDAIKAFASQFFQPNATEPSSPISSEDFLDFVTARMREFGRPVNATFAEGFNSVIPLKIDDVVNLK